MVSTKFSFSIIFLGFPAQYTQHCIYSCPCNPGFNGTSTVCEIDYRKNISNEVLVNKTIGCQDINECMNNESVCGDEMACYNGPGEYFCFVPEDRCHLLCQDFTNKTIGAVEWLGPTANCILEAFDGETDRYYFTL